MPGNRTAPAHAPALGRVVRAAALLMLLAPPGCLGTGRLPPPQNVVFASGARLAVEADRNKEIHDWVYDLIETISCRQQVVTDGRRRPSPVAEPPRGNPNRPEDRMRREVRTQYCMFPGSVLLPEGTAAYMDYRRDKQDARINITVLRGDVETYPWETLVVQGDSARIRVPRAHFESARTAYTVYAYLHLAHAQGRLERWLPDAAGLDGYALERAIVARAAEVWMMGRATLLVDPYPLLDELLLANDAGQLDALLLTLRPDEFEAEREAWLKSNPGGVDAYRAWFRAALDREPPAPRTAREPSR